MNLHNYRSALLLLLLQAATSPLLVWAATAAADNNNEPASRNLQGSATTVIESTINDDLSFLGKYNLKLVGCREGPGIYDRQGNLETSSVRLRLCPNNNGCDSDLAEGCSSGYGEIVMGLRAFVKLCLEYTAMQDQFDDDGFDDDGFDDDFGIDFTGESFGRCEEYDPSENSDGEDAGQWEDERFFVGPACTEDGLYIKLGLFSDDACTQVSDVDFPTIAGGWTLPYEDGGLVSTNCYPCLETNEEEEIAKLSDLCTNSYTGAATKCEERMDYYSFSGKDTSGCEITLGIIAPVLPGPSPQPSGLVAFMNSLADFIAGLFEP